jgi:quinol-cytochrome oxidoreductase complex cytochrome b subunit
MWLHLSRAIIGGMRLTSRFFVTYILPLLCLLSERIFGYKIRLGEMAVIAAQSLEGFACL